VQERSGLAVDARGERRNAHIRGREAGRIGGGSAAAAAAAAAVAGAAALQEAVIVADRKSGR